MLDKWNGDGEWPSDEHWMVYGALYGAWRGLQAHQNGAAPADAVRIGADNGVALYLLLSGIPFFVMGVVLLAFVPVLGMIMVGLYGTVIWLLIRSRSQSKHPPQTRQVPQTQYPQYDPTVEYPINGGYGPEAWPIGPHRALPPGHPGVIEAKYREGRR